MLLRLRWGTRPDQRGSTRFLIDGAARWRLPARYGPSNDRAAADRRRRRHARGAEGKVKKTTSRTSARRAGRHDRDEVSGTGRPSADTEPATGVPADADRGGGHRRHSARTSKIAADPLCGGCAAQPARRGRQPERRHRQPYARAHSRRRSNQTLVLIDGVEANAPTDGEFDFSNLRPTDIERIEVIRGAQSGVYGSKRHRRRHQHHHQVGQGPLTFTARAEGGGFGTGGTTVGMSAGNDKGSFAISYDRRKTDGFNISPSVARTTAGSSRPSRSAAASACWTTSP